SPAVVGQVPDDSLLVATSAERVEGERRYAAVQFGALPETWRALADPRPHLIPRGDLLAYLNPVPIHWDGPEQVQLARERGNGRRRVIDRPDLQLLLPGMTETG